MAHRRKRHKVAKETKKAEKRVEAKKKTKRSVAIAISLALILLTVYLLATNAPVQPMQCFSNGTQFKESYTARIIIYNGTTDFSFIRIPKALPDPYTTDLSYFTMGVYQSCRYPITINGQADYGPNYTTLHIQSPYIHAYTLGDFFFIWSQQLGLTVPFGPDGVSSVNGPTYVSYNFGLEQRADPGMQIHPSDWITIRVYPQG